MKLKNGVRAVILFLLFCVFLSPLNSVMQWKDEASYQSIEGFYEEAGDTLDAVYIGSSNVYSFWNSLLAWKEYGIAVYPFASSSNLFFSTEYLIKEARKTQPDALFIVNINTLTDGEVPDASITRLIGPMPFSFNKIALIHHLCEVGDYSFKDRMEFYLPIIRFHARWNELEKRDFGIELNGFKSAQTGINYSKIVDISDSYVLMDKVTELSDKIVSSTESLLDYCEEEHVNVLFVTVPQGRGNVEDVIRYNSLNAMIEERGYKTLDLMGKTDEIGLDLKDDFHDNSHANYHGSAKFTYYLSEYLINNYGFEDKRDDERYDSWNTALTGYEAYIPQLLLDVELRPRAYDASMKAPELKTEINGELITLSWERIEGAEEYLIYEKNNSAAWERIKATGALRYEICDTSEEESCYTVVPVYYEEGQCVFGNFNYNGVTVMRDGSHVSVTEKITQRPLA